MALVWHQVHILGLILSLSFRPRSSPSQLERSDAIDDNDANDDNDDDDAMLRHNHHLVGSPMTPPPPLMQQQQKFYHYAGPPSIQMSTWQDRAIPGTGKYSGPVPPPVSRMAAGYHSLQYGEVVPPPHPPHAHHQQHHREPKYSRDAIDDRHRAQVRNFCSTHQPTLFVGHLVSEVLPFVHPF